MQWIVTTYVMYVRATNRRTHDRYLGQVGQHWCNHMIQSTLFLHCFLTLLRTPSSPPCSQFGQSRQLHWATFKLLIKKGATMRNVPCFPSTRIVGQARHPLLSLGEAESHEELEWLEMNKIDWKAQRIVQWLSWFEMEQHNNFFLKRLKMTLAIELMMRKQTAWLIGH